MKTTQQINFHNRGDDYEKNEMSKKFYQEIDEVLENKNYTIFKKISNMLLVTKKHFIFCVNQLKKTF